MFRGYESKEFIIEQYSEMDFAFRLIDKEINKSGLNLLDVGCGAGRLGYILKQKTKNLNLYGVDIDIESLQIAKERGYLIQNINLDNEKLAYPAQVFDIVVCLDVIEHVKNPYSLLEEIYRVLKEDGLLLLSTPNIQWIYHIIRLIFGKGPRTYRSPKYHEYDGGHLHYFTFRDVNELLNRCGFKLVCFKGSHNIHFNFIPYLSRLLFNFPILRFYSCPALIVKAKKISLKCSYSLGR